MLPSSQDFEKSIEFFSPFLADFYDYDVASPPAKHQQQGFVGPITREEHDLQLWYSGLLPDEPRVGQEPRNLLGSESYEEYRQRYLLPDSVLTDDYEWENQRNQHRLERLQRLEEEEGENQTTQRPQEVEAVETVHLGSLSDVIAQPRQGIIGTGRILRATAMAVSWQKWINNGG